MGKLVNWVLVILLIVILVPRLVSTSNDDKKDEEGILQELKEDWNAIVSEVAADYKKAGKATTDTVYIMKCPHGEKQVYVETTVTHKRDTIITTTNSEPIDTEFTIDDDTEF